MSGEPQPAKRSPVGIKEVAAVVGAALVGFGLHQAYAPLAPIWAGGVILFLVYLTLPQGRTR